MYCYVSVLCQCVMSPSHVRYHYYVVVLSHCTMSPFFSAVSLFFNVLCTVLCQRDWISLCRSMSRLVSQYAMHRMSMYYVSETGYHYVVVVALGQSVCYAPYVNVLCQRDWISLCRSCRAWSVSMLCTVCQCTMSARLDIIMS